MIVISDSGKKIPHSGLQSEQEEMGKLPMGSVGDSADHQGFPLLPVVAIGQEVKKNLPMGTQMEITNADRVALSKTK